MKFYVVNHPDGYSVQDNPEGVGKLIGFYKTILLAKIVCDAANKAIDLMKKP